MFDSTQKAVVEVRVKIPKALSDRIALYALWEQRDQSNSVRVLLDDALRAADAKRRFPLTREVAETRRGPLRKGKGGVRTAEAQ